MTKLCVRMRDMQCPGLWCFNYVGGDDHFACTLRDGDEPACLRDPAVRPDHTRIGPDQLYDHFDTGYDEYCHMEFPSDAEFELWHGCHWDRDMWRRDRYAKREKGRQREARRRLVQLKSRPHQVRGGATE